MTVCSRSQLLKEEKDENEISPRIYATEWTYKRPFPLNLLIVNYIFTDYKSCAQQYRTTESHKGDLKKLYFKD